MTVGLRPPSDIASRAGALASHVAAPGTLWRLWDQAGTKNNARVPIHFSSMSLPLLLHHLKSHRKIAGLSQRDLAYLLGGDSGTKVSRYERFRRMPPLATVIAYEIIFKASLRSLVPGLYAHVQERIKARAQHLMANVPTGPKGRREAKLALLRSLIHPSTKPHGPRT